MQLNENYFLFVEDGSFKKFVKMSTDEYYIFKAVKAEKELLNPDFSLYDIIWKFERIYNGQPKMLIAESELVCSILKERYNDDFKSSPLGPVTMHEDCWR